MKRSVEHARVEREPHLIWNAFIDLLAMEDYADLSPLQRKAHLVFWYESEVQNGGHGQYFDNRGVDRLAETTAALDELGLPRQAKLLSRAVAALADADAGADSMDVLPDDLIEDMDAEFHQCQPTIIEALQRHLAAHTAEYVEEA